MALSFGVCVPVSESSGMPVSAALDRPNGHADRCEAIFEVAVQAEELGFDSVWVPDHLNTSGATYFECWTTVAALARETHRVRIGQMATSVSFRSPALLAKMAASVDHMSAGRLIVGIGAGWAEQEHIAYGLDYGPSNRYRFDRLVEAAKVLKAMWLEDHPTFEGKFYCLRDAVNKPKPLQSPHPPLWIAGGGETLTLRAVAEFADGCNVFGRPETVRRKLAALQHHCKEVGRDYTSITKSTLMTVTLKDDVVAKASSNESSKAIELVRRPGELVGSKVELVERIRRLVDCGISHFIFIMPKICSPTALESLAEIVRVA